MHDLQLWWQKIARDTRLCRNSIRSVTLLVHLFSTSLLWRRRRGGPATFHGRKIKARANLAWHFGIETEKRSRDARRWFWKPPFKPVHWSKQYTFIVVPNSEPLAMTNKIIDQFCQGYWDLKDTYFLKDTDILGNLHTSKGPLNGTESQSCT